VKVRSKSVVTLLVIATVLMQPQTVYAHQPVDLGLKNTTADQGPILVDATVSFAIRANFTKANQTRGFRAVLKASELLNFEYLIIDKAPENKYAMSKLPIHQVSRWWLNLMSVQLFSNLTAEQLTYTLADLLKPLRLVYIK